MSFFNHKGRPGLLGGSLPRNDLSGLFSILKGGVGSGNIGHAGRPGKHGGSAPKDGGHSFGIDFNNSDTFVYMGKYLIDTLEGQWFTEDGIIEPSPGLLGDLEKKAVQDISKRSGLQPSMIKKALAKWREVSDTRGISDATKLRYQLQETAAEMFNLNIPKYVKEVLDKSGKDRYMGSKDNERKVLQSMYDKTQEEFRKDGIKTITLYRGVDGYNLKNGEKVKIETNPIESWSLSAGIPKMFGSTMIMAEVPVERILSNSISGFGAVAVTEHLVIGGTNDYAVVSSTKE